MTLARTTLDLLNTLSGDAVIVSVTMCYIWDVTRFEFKGQVVLQAASWRWHAPRWTCSTRSAATPSS
jgi:hypothetical protein